MWFVVLGVVLMLIKATDVALAEVSWWWVLSPFVLAMLWWEWADKSGYTKRKQMQKMDEKREDRRRKSLEALGMDARGRREPRK